ncbi:PREDICTED: uncharacterized protein LOC106108511 isoform X1 [Papilio polytes]|uniref:uncharacterized protein LOC106108511 isoform X1 n=1 Tax=Papilio polytes TaxID=76194 RepID=UPI000675C857|nr:PREDICTED: uncharacterized protein LOC106108511 isoform X1 [Papilio polytes]
MHLEKTYDMGNYAILENEYIPVIMKNKPRWMCCAMVATGLLMLMLFSVAVGVVIAYVHCYIEHRSGKRTQELNLQITRTGTQQTNGTQSAMDEALTSSLFFAKIIDLGRAIIEDGHNYIYSYKTKTSNKTEDIKVFQ